MGPEARMGPGGDTADDAGAMQRYYAARAAEYDLVYRKPERQADLALMQAWLPPQLAGRRVLELACGTGWWTRRIAPQAAGVLALDTAAEVLVLARARLAAAGLAQRVQLVQGDAWRLPLPHRHQAMRARCAPGVDAAFAGFWFSHLPRSRWREFLGGLAQVLPAGAPVVLLDNLHVPGSSTPLSAPDADGDTWQLRRLSDGSRHRVLKNHPHEGELRHALRGLGTEPRWQRWGYYWALRYRSLPPRGGRAQASALPSSA